MLKTRGRVMDSSGSFLPFSFVHLNCWVGIVTAGNKHKHQQTVKNEASPLSLFILKLFRAALLVPSVSDMTPSGRVPLLEGSLEEERHPVFSLPLTHPSSKIT